MDDDQLHRKRTKFEPVKERKQEATSPPVSSESKHSAPVSTPRPVLRILEPGQLPQYPGLRCDERGIVVAAQGLVVVKGSRRRAAFLVALSQVIDLATSVQVEESISTAEQTGQADLLVVFTPPNPTSRPSLFFDVVQGVLAVARLSASLSRLYIGDGRVFVPYADDNAPHDYDVQGEVSTDGRLLLDPESITELPASQPAALLDAILEVSLQPGSLPHQVTTLSLLTDRRQTALVAGYILRHGLAFVVRFLSWQGDKGERQAALFDIASGNPESPIPRFIIDFLRHLPRTTLLLDALEAADLETEPSRRVLISWGQRTPFYLPHIQDLLPANSLLILSNSPWKTALINPVPLRQPMRRLVDLAITVPHRAAQSNEIPGRLALSLSLQPGGVSHGPVQGLLLDKVALKRLTRIVRYLPTPFFANTLIAFADNIALLVAADPQSSIEGLPLGQPLVYSTLPQLLLPRGLRLMPTLPQDLLISILGLQADMLTLLMPTERYDVPLQVLRPLSSLLALDAPMHGAAISVQPSPLPTLDLSDLEIEDALPLTGLAVETSSVAPLPSSSPEQERHGLLQQLLRLKPTDHLSFDDELRQRGAQLEQAGDYELAAAFYAYLGDHQKAAECYERVLQSSK